ncbi:MAG: hypothetical protein GX249_10545 [Firmicutes bacterium]|nr:hypothetical protein [Bacillota bacterium]
MGKNYKVYFIAALLVLSLSMVAFAETDLAKIHLEGPIAVTTCGQSPGALMAGMVFMRAGLESHHDDLLTAAMLQEKAAQGEGFRALFISTGTSMKGMGAAGTDINDEIDRITALIAEAKKQGIYIMGAHIEGSARRVDHTDQLSIDAVCQDADMLVVIESSDEDGYFTNLAAERNVPLLKVKEALHLVEPLKDLFKQ